jgi:hypothetical protein
VKTTEEAQPRGYDGGKKVKGSKRHLLVDTPPRHLRTIRKEKKEVPTLEQFQERFLDHARTNNKVSTAKTKADILRKHLVPAFGRLKLDQIDTARLETFKAEKMNEGLSKKSVDNLLTVLRKLLALAQE